VTARRFIDESIAFSNDGHRVTCIYADDRERVFVNINGRKYGPYANVASHVTLSPDSQHEAFAAMRDGHWFVVQDGTEGRYYDRITDLMFSPDSRHLGYVATKNGSYLIIRDRKESRSQRTIVDGSIRFSTDSKHMIVIAQNGTRVFLVVDGDNTSETFSGVATPQEREDGVREDRYILSRVESSSKTKVFEVTIVEDGSA
jgi:hypothetical protein